MNIIVIGAGAWGTALAICAARSGHAVSLLARDAQQAKLLQSQRLNARYLPDAAFPAELNVMLGDLVLTATGDLSRNRKVGLLLAQGKTAAQATESLGHVAEGVRCASAVLTRAQALQVDMPITACVVALLGGQVSAQQAVGLLMGREPSREA